VIRWLPQGVPPAFRVYQISVGRHTGQMTIIGEFENFFQPRG
jgi:hypothetical protein